MSSRNENRETFLDLLRETGKTTVTKKEIRDICGKHFLSVPQWFTKDPANRTGRGLFIVPPATGESTDSHTVEFKPVVSPVQAKSQGPRIQTAVTILEEQAIVPEQYPHYVPFGHFEDIKAAIASNQFFPVFITGQTGTGKSMMVEQACAQLNREFVLYSMTPESDEGDILGNYVLIDGQMVWRDGAVTVAARRGAVLCIDEIDYGAQNLSCLQRVLEGKPFLLKKKNEIVTPKPGFQIVATANTKGKGSVDGRYMFTNVLNEAFLERFPITFEVSWAPAATEKKILKKELDAINASDDEFANHLIMWATTIRKTHEEEGGTTEVISTRRLVHIVRAYPIFKKDRVKAITYCLNRFDDETKNGFLDLYSKIDAGVSVDNKLNTEPESKNPQHVPDWLANS